MHNTLAEGKRNAAVTTLVEQHRQLTQQGTDQSLEEISTIIHHLGTTCQVDPTASVGGIYKHCPSISSLHASHHHRGLFFQSPGDLVWPNA